MVFLETKIFLQKAVSFFGAFWVEVMRIPSWKSDPPCTDATLNFIDFLTERHASGEHHLAGYWRICQ